MTAPESKTSERKTTAAERKRQALDFRMAGMTFQQIGDKLGITKQAAHTLVVAAMDETREKIAESAHQVIAMELERLDSLWRTVYPQAKQGNLGAIDRSLRIMERRARLLGLDAPAKADVTSGGEKLKGYINFSPEEWDKRKPDKDD